MLIQNISKRNFVLKIDGEIKTVGPNTIIEADEKLAKDLVENYNGEWIEVQLPTSKNDSGQKTEKMLETKADKKKK